MAHVRSFVERLERRSHRRDLSPSITCCETCGDTDHATSGCTNRDDATLGTKRPGENGPYRGPLTVRTFPPGWSFLDHHAGTHVRILPGQRWASPDGLQYRVRRVTGQVISLGLASSRNHTYGAVRVRASVLRSRWFYLGKEAPRG